jgi:putative tryptophan/tyrosine transport system substrate-binding protein
MNRRELITLLGGAAVLPAAANAQAMPVIGFLHSQSLDNYSHIVSAFRQTLAEAGYVEGRNITIEYRWANNQIDQLPMLAADLVRRRVAAIVAGGSSEPARAAKAATSTIPIIFAFGGDPVQVGLIASLNRPGANVTGATYITSELGAKRLGLVRELVPQTTAVGYLFDPRVAAAPPETKEMLSAARELGLQVLVLEARSGSDFEPAFAALVERGAGALVVGSQPLFTQNRDKLVMLASRHKLPAIYHLREYVLDGGLMSYGASQVATWHEAGAYVARILKGEKPADLPVMQPTKFELVINLKAAKAMGLTIPESFLLRADEVIE